MRRSVARSHGPGLPRQQCRSTESPSSKIVSEQRGIPLPVLRSTRSLDQYLAAARIVENTVPLTPVEETAQLVEPPAVAGR